MLLSAPLLLPALLGLIVTTVLAVPAQQQQQRASHRARDDGSGGTVMIPTRSDEFSLAMSVNGTYLALVAVSNGTEEDLVLQAQVVGSSPGTPAYINTTSEASAFNTSVVLELANTTDVGEPGAYGLSVPDLGELYGFSQNVLAVRDYQEFEFEVDDGTVFHKLTSASQSWFACEDVVVSSGSGSGSVSVGVPGYFLRWGVFTRQSAAPEGCSVTSVVQDFNIAAGARAARV